MPLPFIPLIISGITSFFGKRQEIKAGQVQNKMDLARAVTEAKIKIVQSSQDADIKWENTAMDNAGWKDEFLTIIISIPLVLSFFPNYAHFVTQGFVALSEVPSWYQAAVGTMIGSAFGVRQFTKFMGLKKGG